MTFCSSFFRDREDEGLFFNNYFYSPLRFAPLSWSAFFRIRITDLPRFFLFEDFSECLMLPLRPSPQGHRLLFAIHRPFDGLFSFAPRQLFPECVFRYSAAHPALPSASRPPSLGPNWHLLFLESLSVFLVRIADFLHQLSLFSSWHGPRRSRRV